MWSRLQRRLRGGVVRRVRRCPRRPERDIPLWTAPGAAVRLAARFQVERKAVIALLALCVAIVPATLARGGPSVEQSGRRAGQQARDQDQPGPPAGSLTAFCALVSSRQRASFGRTVKN